MRRYVANSNLLTSSHLLEITFSIQNGTIGCIRHRATGRKWSVHMTLVESECQADQLKEDLFGVGYVLGGEHDPETFDLFVQWLYTQKYQEKEGLAESLASGNSLAPAESVSESVTFANLLLGTHGRMDWAVKAAILCWDLGASLGAKGFQNYAMERLFEALSRPLSQPLTANLILHASDVKNERAFRGTSPVQRLMQDVIVRNWGDDTIVHHAARNTWSYLLETCPYFRMVFIKATSKTLENRREQELSLEDYLIH